MDVAHRKVLGPDGRGARVRFWHVGRQLLKEMNPKLYDIATSKDASINSYLEIKHWSQLNLCLLSCTAISQVANILITRGED